MTCEVCGCEITNENMVSENLDICSHCYLENEAMSGRVLDNFYLNIEDKMKIDEMLEDYIEDEDLN